MSGQLGLFVVGQRLVHDGRDLLEKVVLEAGIARRLLCHVRDDRSADTRSRIDEPEEILLDGQRHAGRQRAIDAVLEAAFRRVRIVGVNQHPAAGPITRSCRRAILRVAFAPLRQHDECRQRHGAPQPVSHWILSPLIVSGSRLARCFPAAELTELPARLRQGYGGSAGALRAKAELPSYRATELPSYRTRAPIFRPRTAARARSSDRHRRLELQQILSRRKLRERQRDHAVRSPIGERLLAERQRLIAHGSTLGIEDLHAHRDGNVASLRWVPW